MFAIHEYISAVNTSRGQKHFDLKGKDKNKKVPVDKIYKRHIQIRFQRMISFHQNSEHQLG